MKKQVETGLDRISELPEHLKQHILSFLDIKDAAKTSALCTRWRHEWNWLPCLKFDIRKYLQHPGIIWSVSRRLQPILSQESEIYLDFLERALVRRCTRPSNVLERLFLFVPISRPEVASRVDLFLTCAIQCGVRKLSVDATSSTGMASYCLPQSVLTSCSLTALKLVNCTIRSEHPHVINLLSLHKLSLSAVHMDEETLKTLIAGCPTLRKLKISFSSGFKTLKISDVPRLEVVNVLTSTSLISVVIDAQHLQDFSIEGSSFTSPCKINVAACKNIRRLVLNDVAITEDQLSFHLGHLHLLQDLHLEDCNALKNFQLSAQTLKHLTVKYCGRLAKAEIDAPNLESFSYWGYHVFSFFSLNAPTLARASLNLSYSTMNVHPCVSIIEFLSSFNDVVTLTLSIDSQSGVLIPEDLREDLIPPLYNVKHMKVEVRFLVDARYLAEAVDSVLWLCPHPETITISSIVPHNPKEFKFHFMYNEAAESESDSCCCSLIPIKCWRHSLKEVKIGKLKNGRDADLLPLLEEAETLELIEGIFAYRLFTLH